jgi:hypothetical protein
MRIDPVGNRRHEHIRRPHGLGEGLLAHRPVGFVQPRVEKLAHAGLDLLREATRHYDKRLSSRHLALYSPGQTFGSLAKIGFWTGVANRIIDVETGGWQSRRLKSVGLNLVLTAIRDKSITSCPRRTTLS